MQKDKPISIYMPDIITDVKINGEDYKFDAYPIDIVAICGWKNTFDLLSYKGEKCVDEILIYVACTGNLEMFIYLHTLGYELKDSIEAAATFGRLNIIEWLVSNNPNIDVYGAYKSAEFHGHANVVQYLLENTKIEHSKICLSTLCDAIQDGYIEVVKCVIPKYIDVENCDSEVLQAAVEGGRLEVVKYLHKTLSFKQDEVIEALQCIDNSRDCYCKPRLDRQCIQDRVGTYKYMKDHDFVNPKDCWWCKYGSNTEKSTENSTENSKKRKL